MKRFAVCSVVVAGYLTAVLPGDARADELSQEARMVVDEYQRAVAVIQAKADAETALVQRKFIPRLKALQDKSCRAMKLDEALAVREIIKGLLGIRPDPGALAARPEDIGRSFLYLVTGSTQGGVWGSEVYTTDSNLGAAAVHAGLLRPGEKAVLRVKVLPGQKHYLGSTAHGVTTQEYGAWTASFTVERPNGMPEL